MEKIITAAIVVKLKIPGGDPRCPQPGQCHYFVTLPTPSSPDHLATMVCVYIFCLTAIGDGPEKYVILVCSPAWLWVPLFCQPANTLVLHFLIIWQQWYNDILCGHNCLIIGLWSSGNNGFYACIICNAYHSILS